MSTTILPRVGTDWPTQVVPHTQSGEAKPSRRPLPANTGLLACLFAILVVLFQLLRLCFYIRNRDLAVDADAATIARSFLVGLRFDAAVAAYVTVPLLIVAKLARLWQGAAWERRVYTVGYAACGVILTVIGLGELEFYREFSLRYNMLAIQYWSHPGDVLSMIWNGYPVARYLLLEAALSVLYVLAVVGLGRLWHSTTAGPTPIGRWIDWTWTAAATVLLVIAARGGLQRIPLQWGNEVHSDSAFANHLAYNGIWTLCRELLDSVGPSRDAKGWHESMPCEEAHARVQRLLLLSHEQLTGDTARYPLLRQSHSSHRSLSLQPVSGQPPNVVLIMMESFSARAVGVLGADGEHTPEFNRLAEHGILFDRCFSNATRTHQAHFAVGASFPSLPGFEWLMENRWGDQRFDSIPAALKRRGYRTLYLGNGNLAWDNVRDFSKFQGIERFIGVDDFDSSVFKGTWGVLDNVLFERGNREFAKMPGPFFAMIMTASNHVPFQCPRPYPFPEVTDAGEKNHRMNAIRFADWSIGQFFELASREVYFRNTLFVMVGDHGHNAYEVLTELNLLKFHVPLLLYAPELLGDEPRRIHTVASHVDIGPTILGLVGDGGPHQHWGRDLFALPDDDPGFAIIRPTGEPKIGFARGDTLLVKTRNGKNRVYQYDLGFPPRLTEINSPDNEVLREIDKDLHAFIQTGQEVLTERHVAP